MKYNCNKCDFHSNNQSKFHKHLETKKHKQAQNVSSQKQNKISKKTQKSGNVILFMCKYCKKSFSSRQAKFRHEHTSCKENEYLNYKKLINIVNEVLQSPEKRGLTKKAGDLLDQLQIKKQGEDFLDMVKELHNKSKVISTHTSANQIINNNNKGDNTNCFNTNTNIQLNNYNNTNYDFLTDKDMIKCINQCNNSVKTLIEKVHFNKDHPENMNIYISNMKGKYVMIYKENKWQIKDKEDHIDTMFENNDIMLENWYNDFNEKYPHIIKSFEQYLKNKSEDSILIRRLKNDILMLLYNERETVIKNNSGIYLE